MQKGCFTPEAPKHDFEGVIQRINSLSQTFRDLDTPVIFIQQDSSKWNRFIPNTTEWEILSELEVNSKDIFINKTANDAFYQSSLNSTLKMLNITELFITGFATDFCVDATIKSALTKDFDITVVKNGHTTGNKPYLEAESIVKHYNWVWQNLIPTKGSIKVLDYDKLEITTPQQGA